MARLQAQLPWIETPVIVNAPMGGMAGPQLAISVTRAGGLGMMGMVPPASSIDPWLDEVEQAFTTEPLSINPNSSTTGLSCLPIGIGFLIIFMKLDQVVSVLRNRSEQGKNPPTLIWLFAADEPSTKIYNEWATAIRKLYSESSYIPQIWIQVGGSAIAAAELAVSDAAPDAIVIQGSDAGGHGMERGASLISLLPEARDLIIAATSKAGRKPPHILASGGIVDARGALAACTLGAEGLVMGTRFLASPEISISHPEYQERILAARDGAMSTIRAKVFDELKGPNQWPAAYDGRALVSRSWKERYMEQRPIETVRREHAEAVKEKDGGYGAESDRAAVWAGTGVGLVNETKKAGDIVREVREGVIRLAEEVRRGLEGSTGRL